MTCENKEKYNQSISKYMPEFIFVINLKIVLIDKFGFALFFKVWVALKKAGGLVSNMYKIF